MIKFFIHLSKFYIYNTSGMSATPPNRRFWNPLGTKSEPKCIKKADLEQKCQTVNIISRERERTKYFWGVHFPRERVKKSTFFAPGGALGVSGLLFGAPGCLQASKIYPKTPKWSQNCSKIVSKGV